ncbi:MAG: hypothetical protein OXE75_03205 [bacterium]|nr:hypothetical protein [bacterium]
MTLVMALATACGGDSPVAGFESPSPTPDAAGDTRPVVEVVPATAALPPLDPDADPRTPLGELRAGYLPVWSPDFDWAFPPEVCGSDWALDAIAEPTSSADPAVLGDPPAAAALSVMRYEHLVSRALAGPDLLGQLCVAIGAVGATRTGALDLLAGHLAGGTRSAGPSGYPDEVTIVAASPTAILAAACLPPEDPGAPGEGGTSGDPGAPTGGGETPGDPGAAGGGGTPGDPGAAGGGGGATPGDPGAAGGGETVGYPAMPAALRAYLLRISRGLEDSVVDISYRVSDVTHRPAVDCGELDSWLAGWEQQVADWAAGGEIWGLVGRTVSAGELCDSPTPGGPDECPRDWS